MDRSKGFIRKGMATCSMESKLTKNQSNLAQMNPTKINKSTQTDCVQVTQDELVFIDEDGHENFEKGQDRAVIEKNIYFSKKYIDYLKIQSKQLSNNGHN